MLLALSGVAGGAAAVGGPPRLEPPGGRGLRGVDGRLAPLVNAGAGGVVAARAAGLDVRGTRVRVIAESTNLAAAKASVTAVGGLVEQTYAQLIEALVPPSAIRTLARSPGVAEVRAPALHTELAVDEAVAATHADSWQSAGITGTGVKVAIIDGGFQGWQAALPGATLVNEDCGDPEGDQHGTTVARSCARWHPARS